MQYVLCRTNVNYVIYRDWYFDIFTCLWPIAAVCNAYSALVYSVVIVYVTLLYIKRFNVLLNMHSVFL